jgi:hypothetical protein
MGAIDADASGDALVHAWSRKGRRTSTQTYALPRHVTLSRAALFALLTLIAMAGAVVAGPFEDGQAAFERGDFAIAYRLWRPLAEQGNAAAQFRLSIIAAPVAPTANPITPLCDKRMLFGI